MKHKIRTQQLVRQRRRILRNRRLSKAFILTFFIVLFFYFYDHTLGLSPFFQEHELISLLVVIVGAYLIQLGIEKLILDRIYPKPKGDL